MRKNIFPDETGMRLQNLFESSSRLSQLHICFHDCLNSSGLPSYWCMHSHPACEKYKRTGLSTCVNYDRHKVHKELAAFREGRIQNCPFGLTEAAVPVIVNGIFAGVLFAGPCWRGKGKPPHPDLKVVPDEQWLQDRLCLLQALAEKLSTVLEGRDRLSDGGRRARVLSFLNKNIEKTLSIGELAQDLCLSASRTGHLVKELFGMSFPRLLSSLKMQRAAQMLVSDDMPVGVLAIRLGYSDQNYFTRVFSRHYGENPSSYRKRHPLQA
ncbi:MAG: hypothetical protein A2X49_10030 [Lentisphaerae bacterium GWF2_52_8]|nr:MAG: hypothetical protein A2X49_10030 [Lentisphaerae bacterium GWF2_52_8]